MAKVATTALLLALGALCTLQAASALPVAADAEVQAQASLAAQTEAAVEAAQATQVAASSSKALEAAQSGVEDGLATFEESLSSPNNVAVAAALANTATALEQLPSWLQTGDQVDEDLGAAISRDEQDAVDALEAAKALKAEAERNLELATQATSLAEARLAAAASMQASLKAAQKAEATAKAAIAAGLEVAKEAEVKTQVAVNDANEKAKDALKVASTAIAQEKQIAAEEEGVQAADAAIVITKEANEVVGEAVGQALANVENIKANVTAEMQEMEVTVVRSTNAADEALDVAMDAIGEMKNAADAELQLALESGVDADIDAKIAQVETVRQEIDSQLAVIAQTREQIDKDLNDGLSAIKNVQALTEVVIDQYGQQMVSAKEASDAKIAVALTTAEEALQEAVIVKADLEAEKAAAEDSNDATIQITQNAGEEPASATDTSDVDDALEIPTEESQVVVGAESTISAANLEPNITVAEIPAAEASSTNTITAAPESPILTPEAEGPAAEASSTNTITAAPESPILTPEAEGPAAEVNSATSADAAESTITIGLATEAPEAQIKINLGDENQSLSANESVVNALALALHGALTVHDGQTSIVFNL